MDKHVYTACVCPMFLGRRGWDRGEKKERALEEENVGEDEDMEMMSFF